jgi:hypothetical protein
MTTALSDPVFGTRPVHSTFIKESTDVKTGLTHIEKVRNEPVVRFEDVMNIDKIKTLRKYLAETDMCLGLMEDHLLKRGTTREEDREEREKRLESRQMKSFETREEIKEREKSAERRWKESAISGKTAFPEILGGVLYETSPHGLKSFSQPEIHAKTILYSTSPSGVISEEEGISMEGKIFRGNCSPYSSFGLHL